MLVKKFEIAILQHLPELAEFIELIKAEKVTRYLEIGCKHGGSLWRIGNALPKGARIVAVDLPHGDASFKESQPHLEECVKQLRKRCDAHLIIGDSTDPEIIAQVARLGPYDLCFIDANHTEAYVYSDWKAYRPLSRMIAFHDIGWNRAQPKGKMPIDVPKVWDVIKRDYRHKEIKHCPHDNGIGIIWSEQLVDRGDLVVGQQVQP